jgi:hypothetical protein
MLCSAGWKTQAKFLFLKKERNGPNRQHVFNIICDATSKFLPKVQHVTRKKRLSVESASVNSNIVANIHVKTDDDKNGSGGEKATTDQRRGNRQLQGNESSRYQLVVFKTS